MFSRLKNLFKLKPNISKSGYVYSTGGGWGNRIEWSHFKDREVTGWKYRRPKKGDILISKLASGRVGVFFFTKVQYCENPNDMFFATVKDISYFEDASIEIQDFITNSAIARA